MSLEGHVGDPGCLGRSLGSLGRFKEGSEGSQGGSGGGHGGVPRASRFTPLRLEMCLGDLGGCLGRSLMVPWSSGGIPRGSKEGHGIKLKIRVFVPCVLEPGESLGVSLGRPWDVLGVPGRASKRKR